MTVYYIVYDWIPGRKLAVYNKGGNTLEFIDKEHAEYFLKQHPEAVGNSEYEIRSRTVSDDEQLELGLSCNKWEGEE